MDANGLNFWMLADEGHWQPDGNTTDYDVATRTLCLARLRTGTDWPAAEADALARLERVPQTIDPFGTRAFWSAVDAQVMASGAVPGNASLFTPPPGDAVTDLALGYDDLLYVAVGGRITIVDPRQRFDPADAAPVAGFQAWRVAPHPDGGVWALDPTARRLARLYGTPSLVRPHQPYAPITVRPCRENPDPPRLVSLDRATWDADERAVAIASSADGSLAVLFWKTAELTRIRLLGSDGRLGPAIALDGVRTPYSLTWLAPNQIALLVPGANEALTYTLEDLEDTPTDLLADGDVYPLRNHDGGPFLHGVTLPPRYATADGSFELHRLSLPSYLRHGAAANALPLDSGAAPTAWHRLYLEAMIPDHCGVVAWLAAVDDPSEQPIEWYPHQFGTVSASGDLDGGAAAAAAKTLPLQTPRAAWIPSPSEIPFHPGLLRCPSEKDRSGLFTALIQRPGKRVRTLRGRYLKVRLEMQGNGLTTPEVAALRAYGSRFSYAERYLPELYRQDVFGPAADQQGPATPADFLERFLDNFEGILTPLEDRIADSYLLTDPETTPADALDWLGSWIAVAFDTAYDDTQRRDLLRAAPELYRRRGTLRGLGLALDIATKGAVSRGQIVILEDYRLRRTFATILGADLSDADDPLLAGISSSGNSFVGDTLFLGDEHRKEFLALFSATLPTTRRERAAIEEFFDELAHRVTILVHQEIDPQDLGLVRRVAALETPAHVAVRIERATNSFRAGVASLVGVDTYLAPKPRPRPARVDVSYIGRGDLIERAPALDPRLGGEEATETPRRPQAILDAPAVVEAGQPIHLSAIASKAFDGRTLVRFSWTLLQ